MSQIGIALLVETASGGFVAQLRIFEDGGDGIKTVSSDSLVEPELHGAEDCLLHLGIAPVQIGLLLIELVIVELLD